MVFDELGSLLGQTGQENTSSTTAPSKATNAVSSALNDPTRTQVVQQFGANPFDLSNNKANLAAFGGGNLPAITNDDLFPGNRIPIQKGTFGGRFVGNVPIFTPNVVMPYAVAVKNRQAKQQQASAAMLKALSPISINRPKAKHPKFQEQLDKVFFKYLDDTRLKAATLPGGFDNLMSGKTPESIEFKKGLANLDLMRRNADFFIDRAAEIKNFEDKVGIRVPPRARKIANDALNGINDFDIGKFDTDFQKNLELLDATVNLHSTLMPVLQSMRTTLNTELGKIEGVPGSKQWLFAAETISNDFLSDTQINSIIDNIAFDNPGVVYSPRVEEAMSGTTDEEFYAKGDQAYSDEDVRDYFLAILPPQVRAQRQFVQKPQGRSTNVRLNVEAPKVKDFSPDWLLNQWATDIIDIGNINATSALRYDENNFQSSGKDIVATMIDGELVVTPVNDLRGVVTSTMRAASANSKLTGITSENSVAAGTNFLFSTDGASSAMAVQEKIAPRPNEFYRESLSSTSKSLRGLTNEPNPLQAKIQGLLSNVDSGAGVLLEGGMTVMNVNSIQVPDGKKKSTNAWNTTMRVDGRTLEGVIVPEIDVSGTDVFSTNAGLINTIFGDSRFSGQGKSGSNFVFIPDAYYKENESGDSYTIVNKAGADNKLANQKNPLVVAKASLESGWNANIGKYADAYAHGAKTNKYSPSDPNTNVVTTRVGGDAAVQGRTNRPEGLLNNATRGAYLDFVPRTLADLDKLIVQNQSGPEALLFDATAPEAFTTANARGVPEDYARYAIGASIAMNNPNSEFMQILKEVAPNRYNQVLQASINQGGNLTFRQLYSGISDLMLSAYDGNYVAPAPEMEELSPESAARLWSSAVTSTVGVYGSGEISTLLINATKNSR